MKSKKTGTKEPAHAPETAEDYMEIGTLEEESGDKFYGSDPSKALRFYQRAYDAYVQSGLPEAYYNALRLLFHVHSRYQDEAVAIQDLTGVEEVFSAAVPVVQKLGAIAEAHEKAIEIHAGVPFDIEKCDLFFNTAMVYTELLEAGEGPVKRTVLRAMELLTQVAGFQTHYLSASNDIRADMIETARAAFCLVVAAMEAADPTDDAALATVQASGHGVESGPVTASVVAAMTGPFVRDVHLFLDGIDTSGLALDELNIAKAYLVAATEGCVQDPEQIAGIWSSAWLPNTPERYMLAADSIESFLFQREIAPRPGSAIGVMGSGTCATESAAKVESYWRALTEMTKSLKCAEGGLRQRLEAARHDPQALGVGQIIAQLARVYIARADIDLQRRRLPRETSDADRALLLKNCTAFLTNAQKLAQGSGGIRETFVERTQRSRRRAEALVRLCVLEGRASAQELDGVLGPGKWQHELNNLALLWYWTDLA